MALFKDFHEERLPLYNLNFGVITLLPKVVEAKQIQQYRLICVLNVCFKIFTKGCTNRLNRIAQTVASASQTAFMPGKISWKGWSYSTKPFTSYTLRNKMGSFSKLTLKRLTTKLNGHSFNKHKEWKDSHPNGVDGLKEWLRGVVMGSRSMMTYVTRPVQYIVADMLAILIKRAKDDGQIGGVIPHLVDDGLSILQYADDTILFLDHDIE